MIIHKQNSLSPAPKVSVILLDWSVRERFNSLDWLSKQNVPRDKYEIIWVEFYRRVIPEVMKKADVVITCEGNGLYHKHVGLNAGILYARGQIVTMCDSDVVFPPNFIESIIHMFSIDNAIESQSLVLMHYEWRTSATYPENLSDIKDLKNYLWWDLCPNVGACVSVRRMDAIRYGGWDEHKSYRGYIAGADLPWRLVNAGLPEIWHDQSVTLWHFSHPAPNVGGTSFSLKRWFEIAHPHIDLIPLTAVEVFSSGRILPLQENSEIHQLRMKSRRIGTKYEEKYATMYHVAGLSKWQRFKLYVLLVVIEAMKRFRHSLFLKIRSLFLRALKKIFGFRKYEMLKSWWRFK